MPALFSTPIHFACGASLPGRLLPAPMEGVTNGAWVKVLTARRYVNCWWTPFLRISTAVPRKGKLTAWLAPYLETGLPVIAQLMGTNSQLLAQAGKALHDLGATVIDLNCACPSPAVLSNHAGGYRLKYPDWIGETLMAMRDAIGEAPLAIKLRMGFDSKEEFSEAIAPVILHTKPDMTTVHFRTVREKYLGISDGLARMAAIRSSLPGIFLVGCGDITDRVTASKMMSTGVDAIACARGMLKNPRLLVDIQEGCRRSFDSWEIQDFLQELSAAGAPIGFTLQIAANLLGRDTEEFNQLLYTLKK